MSRIADILLRARDSLSDPKGQRWSDDRLLRLLDEAQKDIVRRAKLLRAETVIYVIEGRNKYKLPEDLLLLTRVIVKDRKVDITNHEDLDERNPEWEVEEGEIERIVLDRRNRHILKTYKIPVNIEQLSSYQFTNSGYLEDITYESSSDFGILVGGEEGDVFASSCTEDPTCGVVVEGTLIVNTFDEQGNYIGQIEYDFDMDDFGVVGSVTDLSKDILVRDSTYGVLVDVDEFDILSDFGVLADIQDDDIEVENLSSDFGIVVDVTESDTKMHIYYIKKPATLKSLDDELEVDSMFDSALKYYIVGKALRDDMDTMNRQVGNEELQFYYRELEEAMKDDALDFVRAGKNYEVKYRGGL